MKLNKLYNVSSPRCWYFIASLLFTSVWYFSWIWVVDPAPDKDATAFFSQYEHYLSMVSAGISPFADFKSWLALSGDLPPAMMVIPTTISYLGLQDLFLSQLWFREIFLIVPITLVPFILSSKDSKFFEFTLVLFFFPVTQILLKGFEHHAYNTIYTLVGFVFLYKYTLRRNPKLLSGFVIFCTFSNLAKHMGLIHFMSIVMAVLVIESQRDKIDRCLWFSIGLILAVTALLYPYDQTVRVIQSTLRHTHSVTMTEFLFASFMICAFGLVLSILVSKFSKNLVPPNLFKGAYFLAIAFVFILWLLLSAGRDEYFLPIWIGGYTLVYLVIFLFKSTSKIYLPLLVALLSFTHAALLFTLKIASTFYIFHFSLVLLLVYTYHFSKSNFGNKLLLIIFFTCSNFYPSLTFLQTNNSMFQYAYTHLFLSLHQNPLGWEKSDLRKIQRKMLLTLKSYEPFDIEPLLVATVNLDFSTREVLNFLAPHTLNLPPVYYLDQAPQNQIESLVSRYKTDKEKLFQDWTSKSKVKVWIVGVRPWTQKIFPRVETIDFNSDSYNTYKFSTDLPYEYWIYLKNNKLLQKHFDLYEILTDNPRVNVYIHKSLKSTIN